ncbi:MAG TPA: hypothetical protein VIV61_09930 [Candidatus Ozemobacteraceae bacterium]
MNRLFGLLIMVSLLVTPAMAQTLTGFKVNPNDQVVVSLLTMVLSDLDMCGRSLNKSIGDTIGAVGHLNNAQSALKRTQLDPAYSTLITEILSRISKIKFYVVMNDVDGAAGRLGQLIGIIRGVLGAETGTIPGYGTNGGQIGTTVPSRPMEIPVGQSGSQVNGSGMGGIGLPGTN